MGERFPRQVTVGRRRGRGREQTVRWQLEPEKPKERENRCENKGKKTGLETGADPGTVLLYGSQAVVTGGVVEGRIGYRGGVDSLHVNGGRIQNEG